MSQTNIPPQYIEDDEITLKELILKLKEFWREIWKNWLLIGIITLPFVLWFLYDAWSTPVKYYAPITFMINEEGKGGSGGLASVGAQLGINLGGGGGEFNKDKIVALAKSGKIIYPIILDSVEINGKEDILGNHIIDIYGLRDVWKENSKNEKLHEFEFKNTDRNKFDRVDNIALKGCFSRIIGNKSINPLMTCRYDKDTGILTIATTSVSQELSLQLTEKVYDRLSTFYILQQTEPQQTSLDILKAKADSVESLIASKEIALANLKDSKKNVVFSRFQIQERRIEREIPAYANQYAAILKNVENADFLLSNSMPFFQVIDAPFYPLSSISASKFRAVIMGGVFGVFLGIAFVIGRKIIRDSISEE